MSKKIQTIVVDTLNAIQNNQYMDTLNRNTMVSRDKWKDFGVDVYAFMVEDLQRHGFEVVLVLGYEGHGKSFGIKHLEPGTNVWFNADRKNPTFKNVIWKGEEFNAREVYGTKNNPTYLMPIPKTYADITAYIEGIKKKGALADNPVAFIIGHVQENKGTDGQIRQGLKTLGNLATKMNIEGSVEYCLYAAKTQNGDALSFKLDTRGTAFNSGRSPEGAFEERYIDNNFHTVYQAIQNY